MVNIFHSPSFMIMQRNKVRSDRVSFLAYKFGWPNNSLRRSRNINRSNSAQISKNAYLISKHSPFPEQLGRPTETQYESLSLIGITHISNSNVWCHDLLQTDCLIVRRCDKQGNKKRRSAAFLANFRARPGQRQKTLLKQLGQPTSLPPVPEY